MRINKTITSKEKILQWYSCIFSPNSLWKCIEISVENWYVDIEAWRVKNHFSLALHFPLEFEVDLIFNVLNTASFTGKWGFMNLRFDQNLRMGVTLFYERWLEKLFGISDLFSVFKLTIINQNEVPNSLNFSHLRRSNAWSGYIV